MLLSKLLLLILINFSSSKVTCPTASWTNYKTNDEGSWSFTIPDSREITAIFAVDRKTLYCCSNEKNVTFRTSYRVSPIINSYFGYYRFTVSSLGTCDQECNSRNVTVQMFYRNRGRKVILGWLDWSELKPLGEFVYLNKNCNKFYWTAWLKISSCGTSRHANYIRSCEDCDDVPINSIFCLGNETKQDYCYHMWGEWVTVKPCNMTACNSTGKRLRERQCLYGDSSEVANVQLCSSYSNESAVIEEQCDITELPTICQPHWNKWSEAGPCIVVGCNSTGKQKKYRKCLYGDGGEALDEQLCSNTSSAEKIETCNNTNLTSACIQSSSSSSSVIGLYVGIAVAATFIIALCILFAVIRHRHRKTEQLHLNVIETENVSPNDLPTDNSTLKSKITKSEPAKFAKTNVSFENNETLANVYNSIQPTETEIYEQVMPNGSESAVSTINQTQQPIRSSAQFYSSEKTSKEKNDQADEYSVLAGPSDLSGSEYSSLYPR